MKSKLLIISIVSAAFCLCSCGNSKEEFNLIPVKSNGQWGYINRQGTYVINPQFKSAEFFFDNLARVVSQNDKVGYINDKGLFAIADKYQDGTRFSEGLAFVLSEEGKISCINTNGEVVFDLPETVSEAGYFNNGVALISENGKTGYVDKSGKTIIPTQYESGFFASNGNIIGVKQNDKWGFAGLDGKIAINPQFEDLSSPTQFAIAVRKAKGNPVANNAPLLKFEDAVVANRNANIKYIDKTVSDISSINGITYDGYFAYVPATDVNFTGLGNAFNYWIANADMKNGGNQSSKITTTALIMTIAESSDVEKLVGDWMNKISDNSFDGDEMTGDFNEGSWYCGHYIAHAFSSKKYLSYFVDAFDNTISVYTSNNSKTIDKLRDDACAEFKKNVN